jgi:hypothetical protein
LIDNKIGDEGASKIANALVKNSTLHTLRLGGMILHLIHSLFNSLIEYQLILRVLINME